MVKRIPTATPKVKPARRLIRSRLFWVVIFGAGCQSQSLLPLKRSAQRSLTAEVEQVIDSQISQDIRAKHHNLIETDEIYCVHNQTHLRSPDDEVRLVLYAKIVCGESSLGASLENERHKDLSNLITLPIKIEVAVDEKEFDVLGWQYPRGVDTYENDAARMFPPEGLSEITSTEMALEHFDRIREKVDVAKE